MSPFWSCSGTDAHVSKIWVELTASADTFSGAAEGTAKNQWSRLASKVQSIYVQRSSFHPNNPVVLEIAMYSEHFVVIRLNLQEYNGHVNLFNISNKFHKSWVLSSSILPESTQQEKKKKMLGLFAVLTCGNCRLLSQIGNPHLQTHAISLTALNVVFRDRDRRGWREEGTWGFTQKKGKGE